MLNFIIKNTLIFLILSVLLIFLSSCSAQDYYDEAHSSQSDTNVKDVNSLDEEVAVEEEEPVVGEEISEEDSSNGGSEDDTKDILVSEAICVRVIDGDTIELDSGERVRYIGINTPETDEQYGDEATSINSDLVLNKTLRLEKDVSETDKYGRLLRYVYVGDIFVNAYLVENGYAQVSTYPPDVKYSNYFKELQSKAIENETGFWAPEEEEDKGEAVAVEEEEPVVGEELEEEVIATQGIEIVSLTSPIARGSNATITIKTTPNILCAITVYYKSGASKASGLEPKNSDGNGSCTWSWKVGSRTTPGDWKIVLTAEGVGQIETYFTVTK